MSPDKQQSLLLSWEKNFGLVHTKQKISILYQLKNLILVGMDG